MFYRILILLSILIAPLLAQNISQKKDSNQKILTNDVQSTFRACAYGNTSACNDILSLGVISLNECKPSDCAIIGALLLAADMKDEAIMYLKKACLFKEISSCKNLGFIYDELGEYASAREFYTQGCANSDTLSCYNLGIIHAHHIVNENLAKTSFKKACDAHYAKACFNLAMLQRDKNEKSLAKYYFDKSCDLGLNKACEILKSYANTPMPTLQKSRGLYVKFE